MQPKKNYLMQKKVRIPPQLLTTIRSGDEEKKILISASIRLKVEFSAQAIKRTKEQPPEVCVKSGSWETAGFFFYASSFSGLQME